MFSQNEEAPQSPHRGRRAANETLSIVGWREVPTNRTCWVKSPSPCLRIEQSSLTPRPAGARAIWSAACSRRAAASRKGQQLLRLQLLQSGDDLCPVHACGSAALLSRSGGPAPESAICLFHQRFSTNTVPRWPLAQPFRYRAQRRNQHHHRQPPGRVPVPTNSKRR
ncbi:hypothetical protein M8494_28295 [Serratia ureilytica]